MHEPGTNVHSLGGDMAQVKIGALCWNQYSEWPGLLAAGVRADELGYDSLWTWGKRSRS
jgi:hypothetical protein